MIIETSRLGGEGFDIESQSAELREHLLKKFVSSFTKERTPERDLHFNCTTPVKHETNSEPAVVVYPEKQAV